MSRQSRVWHAWGKSHGERVHPLICHALDTAAVAERAIDLFLGQACHEELVGSFEPLGNPVAWVAMLCGLHDLGKCSPAFQGLRAELALARFGDSVAEDLHLVRKQAGWGRRFDTPHGLVTAMHLKDLLESWKAPVDTAEFVAAALGGHHGQFPDGSALRQAQREVNNHGRAAWRSRRDEFVREFAALRGLTDPSVLPWQDVRLSIGAAVGLAALTTISDWIASDTTNFPYADTTDLANYTVTVGKLAGAAVARLRLRSWVPPPHFADLFPETPRPVQAVVDRMTVNRAEPTLVLIEAPTGEGKSKAALQAAAALVRNLGLAGTYVAMPTRATSNQMLGELEAVIERLGSDIPVQLIHSSAKEHLAERVTTPTDVGRDDPDDSDTAAQEWFTRKKNLLASMGVGTVDQALKAAIRSGHVFVRLAALTNKVVVIDEIHAYDTYMSTLLDRLLTWLGHFGVSVVMASATLPAGRRRELVASWQSGLLRCLARNAPSIEPSDAYPRVTLAGAGEPIVEAANVSAINASQTTRLMRVSDDETVEWALDQVQGGGAVRSVAVMHNLVRRVEDTHAALKERIDALPPDSRPELIRIHGRLDMKERRDIENWLRSAFGPQGTRPHAIVVSSQVLEQGLDLDFDTMITDLAPVDWLIQRAGRLHRHERGERRGEPVLAITGVTDTEVGPRFPPYSDRVYAPMIMLRTWALLRERAALSLPGEVPALVDTLYGAPGAVTCPAGWEDAWQDAEANFVRGHKATERNGRLMYLPLPDAISHLGELTKNSKDSSRTRENRGRS